MWKTAFPKPLFLIIIMALSVKLTDLRQEKGFSLKDVADKVGVTKSYIWELEKGKATNPSADLVDKLALLFGVPVDFLFNPNKKDLTEEDAAQVFYRELRSLSEPDQKNVLDIMKMLRDRAAHNNGNKS
jgi:transcriptional regulator with XRE-family HTH domain